MRILLDARGLVGSEPVVQAKKKLEALGEQDVLEVTVDNKMAVSNLMKFATSRKMEAQREKKEENYYLVRIYGADAGKKVAEEEEIEIPAKKSEKNIVIVFDSRSMGKDERIGDILVKRFVYALTEQETFPHTLIFYNDGAYLTEEGSPILEDLQKLEKKGVMILTCGTCINYLRLNREPAVGVVTNMYEIAQKMIEADSVIKL